MKAEAAPTTHAPELSGGVSPRTAGGTCGTVETTPKQGWHLWSAAACRRFQSTGVFRHCKKKRFSKPAAALSADRTALTTAGLHLSGSDRSTGVSPVGRVHGRDSHASEYSAAARFPDRAACATEGLPLVPHLQRGADVGSCTWGCAARGHAAFPRLVCCRAVGAPEIRHCGITLICVLLHPLPVIQRLAGAPRSRLSFRCSVRPALRGMADVRDAGRLAQDQALRTHAAPPDIFHMWPRLFLFSRVPQARHKVSPGWQPGGMRTHTRDRVPAGTA